jgi:hypothetical protein
MSQDPSPCAHEDIAWEPVEIDYSSDGTAEASQIGACIECGASHKINYEPVAPEPIK